MVSQNKDYLWNRNRSAFHSNSSPPIQAKHNLQIHVIKETDHLHNLKKSTPSFKNLEMAKISKLLLKSLLISKSRAEEERFEVTSCNDPNSAVGFKIIYGQEKNSSEEKF